MAMEVINDNSNPEKLLKNEPFLPVILSEAKNLKLYPYIQAWRFLTSFGMTGKRVLRHPYVLLDLNMI